MIKYYYFSNYLMNVKIIIRNLTASRAWEDLVGLIRRNDRSFRVNGRMQRLRVSYDGRCRYYTCPQAECPGQVASSDSPKQISLSLF